MAKTHPWEAAGLGIAPFQFSRFERAPRSALACDVCGRRIGNVFWVRDAKGTEFRAGSECIQKVEPFYSPLRKDAEEAIKKARNEETERRVANAWVSINANPVFMTDERSPYRLDKTLREWATFALENGGNAKKLEVCRVIEAYAAKRSIR